jgi:hypothetical protein
MSHWKFLYKQRLDVLKGVALDVKTDGLNAEFSDLGFELFHMYQKVSVWLSICDKYQESNPLKRRKFFQISYECQLSAIALIKTHAAPHYVSLAFCFTDLTSMLQRRSAFPYGRAR